MGENRKMKGSERDRDPQEEVFSLSSEKEYPEMERPSYREQSDIPEPDFLESFHLSEGLGRTQNAMAKQDAEKRLLAGKDVTDSYFSYLEDLGLSDIPMPIPELLYKDAEGRIHITDKPNEIHWGWADWREELAFIQKNKEKLAGLSVEEIASLRNAYKTRFHADLKARRGGAEYVEDDSTDRPRFRYTKEQVQEARREMTHETMDTEHEGELEDSIDRSKAGVVSALENNNFEEATSNMTAITEALNDLREARIARFSSMFGEDFLRFENGEVSLPLPPFLHFEGDRVITNSKNESIPLADAGEYAGAIAATKLAEKRQDIYASIKKYMYSLEVPIYYDFFLQNCPFISKSYDLDDHVDVTVAWRDFSSKVLTALNPEGYYSWQNAIESVANTFPGDD